MRTSLIVFLACAAGFASGCKESAADPHPKSTFASESAQVATIPFDRYMNLVFLNVVVNGRPLSFNLDSGLESSILDSAQAEKLGLELKEKTQVPVPGGTLELAVRDGVRIELPGISLPQQRVRTLPLSVFAPVLGRPIQGTLGHDLFLRYVVEIDYEAQRIVLHQPEVFNYNGHGEILPLTLEEDQSFVQGEILQPGRGSIPAKLKIDTGSADALGLNGSFVKETKLIAAGQRVVPQPGIALGGITENYVARLQGLRLGRFDFPNIVVGYSKDLERGGDAGTLGGEILRRFTVIFDYSRRRLILEPNSEFSKPFDYDASGIFPALASPRSSEVKILRVTAGSAAAEAGLDDGDIIEMLDGAPPPSIEELRHRFTRAGEHHRLRIRRGGRSRDVLLVLRRLV